MEIIEELTNLRNDLKKEFEFFPRECCRESSRRMVKLGFEETFGLFIDDNGLGNGHHWNKKDGKIWDITANQFSDNLPDIYLR